MAFTKIAIFGATGNVGTPIAKELIAKFKSGVVVFTRPDSATTTADKKALLDEFTAGGAKVVPVDLTNVAQVAEALKGIEVVISAVNALAATDQEGLIEASKAAGTVKRFYPSEFGIDDVAHGLEGGMFGTKQGIRQKVIDAGLECVSVVTGHFLEWQVSPFYKFDFETMTTTIYGDGNTKISFTSLGDIARFTAGSINHPDLQNPGQKQFFVRTAHVHASMNEIIADYAAVKGKSFKPTYVTIADAEKSLEGQPPMSVFRDRLMILQASGKSQVVPNANWPNVVATPEDFKYFFGKK